MHAWSANTDIGYIVDHGITIYYAVIPGEIIYGHPKEHSEATMHGRIPGSRYPHHVMVALFDAQALNASRMQMLPQVLQSSGSQESRRDSKHSTPYDAVTHGNYSRYGRIKVTVKTPLFEDKAHLEFLFKRS